MKVLPSGLSGCRLRNTSPQAQCKKLGMVPRIFPCVPLPEPGAPNMRIVRYFIIWSKVERRGSSVRQFPSFDPRPSTLGSFSCLLVFELNFLDFSERHHHLLPRRALHDLKMEVVGRNPRDALDLIVPARRFHEQHQVLVRFAPDEAEKIGKLRLKKPAVEHELAALENLRRGLLGGRRRLPRRR